MWFELTAGRTGGILASVMGVNIFPVRPVFPQHQQLSCSFTSLVTGWILCVLAPVPPPSDCEGDGPPGGYGSRESILQPEAKRIWKRQRQDHRYGWALVTFHRGVGFIVWAERSTWNASCGQQRSTPDEVMNCGRVFVVRWCFSGSWDPGHTNDKAVRRREEPAFELGGGVAMRCSTLLSILTGVLLYLVLGAVVFRTLETPQEQDKHLQLQGVRRDFLLNFSCVGPDNLQDFIEVEELFCLKAKLGLHLLTKQLKKIKQQHENDAETNGLTCLICAKMEEIRNETFKQLNH